MAKTIFDDGNASLGVLGTRVLAAWLNLVFSHRHTGQNEDGSAPLIEMNELSAAVLAQLVDEDRIGTPELTADVVSKLMPAGAIIHTAASFAPAGYLPANGAAVSRLDYPALFATIGITYGAGDGANTFNLPDLRGEFIRGLDSGRGIDVGRALGSVQTQAIQSHTHLVAGDDRQNNAGVMSIVSAADAGSEGIGSGNIYNTGATGGSETRPRNVALLACIKY